MGKSPTRPDIGSGKGNGSQSQETTAGFVRESSLTDLVTRLKRKRKSNRGLNAEIWRAIGYRPLDELCPSMLNDYLLVHAPNFTGSLDQAVKLYKSKPKVIPNSPLKICIDALEQYQRHGPA